MIAYPVVYTCGTLPIAVGRMMTLSGKPPSDRYLIWAGVMLTSCGWVDGLLYTITRKVFRDSDSERYRNSSAVSTVEPLSTLEPSDSSSHPKNPPQRPKLTTWMRTVSASSVRAPLVQVDSGMACTRQERCPSVDSTWAHAEMAAYAQKSFSTPGMSFVEFLNGGEDMEMGFARGEEVQLEPIPESPVLRSRLSC